MYYKQTDTDTLIEENMRSLQQIQDKFPLAQARPGQLETIKYVLDSFDAGKRFVVLEAPTGAGKSVIGVTVANFFDSAYYLTIQKNLMDQLTVDFGEDGQNGDFLVPLKGRNAYECTIKLNPLVHKAQEVEKWNDAIHDCADGYCRRKGKSSLEECIKKSICPYFIQVDKARVARTTLMNFSSFLFQTNFTSDRFGKRDLIILDEGHNIESQLMDFVSVSVTDLHLDGLKIPASDNPVAFCRWVDDNGIIEKFKCKLNKARIDENMREADELESLIRKLDQFRSEVAAGNAAEWVVEVTQSGTNNKYSYTKAVLKPIYVRKYAYKYLFDWADHILIMSATILDVNVIATSLGIERSQIAAKRMVSTFPVENRPIYYKPVAKVTGGKNKMDDWGPPLIAEVNRLAQQYDTQRGIIHTHNFSIADMLLSGCDDSVRCRLLHQRDFGNNKTEMLSYHAKSTNTIIVAPAMHEGVDLKDDLSRFQIVCKVPFPNFKEDKQLEARMAIDQKFYDWLVALKLVQSVGRSVRSETDWADTYIIDESFGWWYARNKAMLPVWFREAIKDI